MKKPKKKFDFPTQANTDGEISVRSGLNPNRIAGDSVDEHNKLEAANEEIAKDEISQIFNNS